MLCLDIVIIGGGIGGLSAAIFLAQDGHKVTVLERRTESIVQGTGGIALFHNSKTIWMQRGLLSRILDVADSGPTTQIFSYKGDLIADKTSPQSHSFVHRTDLLRVLLELAEELKVAIRTGTTVNSISHTDSKPKVTLIGDEQIEADLITAADGINSFLRRQLYPNVRPRLTSSVVLLVETPRGAMLETEATAQLLGATPFQHWLGPFRDIVAWSMKKHDPPCYHLQVCDHDYQSSDQTYGPDSIDGPLVSIMDDTTGLKKRLHDFEPRIQHILNSVQSFTRWKVAEVPELPSWSSSKGGFVLLGDAAHAVPPFAGQGANMSIEDAGCLATLLGLLSSKEEIPRALKLYDSIRMPRLARLRRIIQRNIETFGATDQAQRDRDAGLSGKQGIKDTSDADWQSYGSKQAWNWLIGYDIIAATKQAWGSSRNVSRDHML